MFHSFIPTIPLKKNHFTHLWQDIKIERVWIFRIIFSPFLHFFLGGRASIEHLLESPQVSTPAALSCPLSFSFSCLPFSPPHSCGRISTLLGPVSRVLKGIFPRNWPCWARKTVQICIVSTSRRKLCSTLHLEQTSKLTKVSFELIFLRRLYKVKVKNLALTTNWAWKPLSLIRITFFLFSPRPWSCKRNHMCCVFFGSTNARFISVMRTGFPASPQDWVTNEWEGRSSLIFGGAQRIGHIPTCLSFSQLLPFSTQNWAMCNPLLLMLPLVTVATWNIFLAKLH